MKIRVWPGLYELNYSRVESSSGYMNVRPEFKGRVAWILGSNSYISQTRPDSTRTEPYEVSCMKRRIGTFFLKKTKWSGLKRRNGSIKTKCAKFVLYLCLCVITVLKCTTMSNFCFIAIRQKLDIMVHLRRLLHINTNFTHFVFIGRIYFFF